MVGAWLAAWDVALAVLVVAFLASPLLAAAVAYVVVTRRRGGATVDGGRPAADAAA